MRVKSDVTTISKFAARAVASAGALALSTTLAWGTGGGDGGEGSSFGTSQQVQVEGEIESECHFTTVPSNVTIPNFANGATSTPAPLGFACNFAASHAVTIKVKSKNGALKRDGGTETVAYAVTWDIQSDPDASGYPADGRNPAQFDLQSGAYNGPAPTGNFSVTVTGTTVGKPAGTYKDILTYEICP